MEWYGPFDINTLETREVELYHFNKIRNTKVLKIEVKCEDEDGRKYTGEVELSPGSKAVRIFKLAAAGAKAN